MSRNTAWRPVPALGCMSLGLGLLTLAGLGFGPRLSFAILGWQPLASLGAGWGRLFGWAAWPIGLLLALAGAGLLARATEDPWRLPWTRSLAVELLIASILALIGLARGTVDPAEAGPEGLVGWALASASREAFGALPAWMLWIAAGLLGGLSALRIGGHRLAEGLDRLADSLAVEPPRAPGPDTIAPPSDAQVASGAAELPKVRASTWTPEAETPAADPPSSRVAQSPMPAAPAPAPAGAPRKRRPPPVRDASRPAARKGRAPRRSDLLPGLDLLDEAPASAARVEDEALQVLGGKLEAALASFGVPVEVVEIERGPTFSRFGLKPGYVMRGDQRMRVKVSRITALRQDLALALSAPTLRIEAPVPGRPVVGIEVPNPSSSAVGLRSVLEDPAFRRMSQAGGLAIAMGREVTGETVVSDLARMPHLLVAGATGSGKSVFLNVLLASLLFQNTPDGLRMILIDPKRVELGRFGKLPHLMAAPVTDPAEAVGALRWVVAEMDRRYRLFAERGARDRARFNAQSPAGEAPVPALVVVIDELADLMMTAPDEVEPLLTRLAQLGRATGIHLVVATQRPSTDVVTGLIKANFPTRVAFAVASGIDSRVILDQLGAETLLGRGDMLFQPPDQPHMRRLQAALVEDAELDRLIDFWKGSHWDPPGRLPPWEGMQLDDDPDAELYAEAQRIALESRRVSASMLQRKLRIGYGRARKLYDRLEEEGMTDDRTDSQGFDWVDEEFPG